MNLEVGDEVVCVDPFVATSDDGKSRASIKVGTRGMVREDSSHANINGLYCVDFVDVDFAVYVWEAEIRKVSILQKLAEIE